jgi:hypothetical protein
LQKVYQVCQKFNDLDQDADGFLSEDEVGRVRPFYNTGSTMVPFFLERVFDEHITSISPLHNRPAMSLVEFVDFLLAWQNRGQPASCRHAPWHTAAEPVIGIWHVIGDTQHNCSLVALVSIAWAFGRDDELEIRHI